MVDTFTASPCFFFALSLFPLSLSPSTSLFLSLFLFLPSFLPSLALIKNNQNVQRLPPTHCYDYQAALNSSSSLVNKIRVHRICVALLKLYKRKQLADVKGQIDVLPEELEMLRWVLGLNREDTSVRPGFSGNRMTGPWVTGEGSNDREGLWLNSLMLPGSVRLQITPSPSAENKNQYSLPDGLNY